jgi:hypothetical protein
MHPHTRDKRRGKAINLDRMIDLVSGLLVFTKFIILVRHTQERHKPIL